MYVFGFVAFCYVQKTAEGASRLTGRCALCPRLLPPPATRFQPLTTCSSHVQQLKVKLAPSSPVTNTKREKNTFSAFNPDPSTRRHAYRRHGCQPTLSCQKTTTSTRSRYTRPLRSSLITFAPTHPSQCHAATEAASRWTAIPCPPATRLRS